MLDRECELTVVVPAHDEAANVGPLLREIEAALAPLEPFEVVFVDDASEDDTAASLAEACRTRPWLTVVRHPRNRGQSAAVRTGVRVARGRLVATLDADGQNDPADIVALLSRWKAVRAEHPSRPVLMAGLRARRRDSALRRLSSRIANGVRARLLGDGTPDTGCGLKLFERADFLELPAFDHMHRFLPALFRRAGGVVESVPVGHRHRTRGRSHYGVRNRLWVGVVDLFGVMWLQRRARVAQADWQRAGESP